MVCSGFDLNVYAIPFLLRYVLTNFLIVFNGILEELVKCLVKEPFTIAPRTEGFICVDRIYLIDRVDICQYWGLAALFYVINLIQ